MHISRAFTVVTFSFQLIAAAIIPYQVRSSDDDTDSISVIGTSPIPNLFSRAPKQSTCPCENQKCKRNKIRDPNNCRRCIPCPPKFKADPSHTVCRDTEKPYQKEKNNKRREKKEKRYEKTKEKKEKRYEKTKEKKRGEFKDKMKKADDRKKLRMGKCVPMVATVLGLSVAAPFLVDFFSEEFLQSDEILEFWDMFPPGLPGGPDIGDDNFVDSDEFVDSYVNLGNEGVQRRATMHTHPKVEKPKVEKRFLKALLEAIKQGFKYVGRAIARGGRGGGGAKKLDESSVKIAKGRGTKSAADQKNALSKLKENKNWKRCLEGKKAEK